MDQEPFPRGTPIERIHDGARGRVTEAIGPSLEEGTYGYWVAFEDAHGVPTARIFVAGSHLRRVTQTAGAGS